MVSMVDAHSALSREIVHQEKLSLPRETEGRFSRLRVKWQRCTLPIKIISIDNAIKIRYIAKILFSKKLFYEVDREFRFEFVILYELSRNISLFFISENTKR